MLKMSPFLTFLLYCLFVGFTIYYLTKDKLDETSRYMLIAVLILPYIFMDQSEGFSNFNKTRNETEQSLENFSNPSEIIENPTKIEQPIITLRHDEKVENMKVLEEINRNKQELELKQKQLESSKKTFTVEEVQELLNRVNNKKDEPLIENYGSMYNGDPLKTYNEDATFTSQLLKPLGENGNGFTNEWDHDYILLNTDKWGPALNPPPVCKTEKTCPVCPNMTTGYPLMVRDFDSSRRVTPPIKADITSMNNTMSKKPLSPSMS